MDLDDLKKRAKDLFAELTEPRADQDDRASHRADGDRAADDPAATTDRLDRPADRSTGDRADKPADDRAEALADDHRGESVSDLPPAPRHRDDQADQRRDEPTGERDIAAAGRGGQESGATPVTAPAGERADSRAEPAAEHVTPSADERWEDPAADRAMAGERPVESAAEPAPADRRWEDPAAGTAPAEARRSDSSTELSARRDEPASEWRDDPEPRATTTTADRAESARPRPSSGPPAATTDDLPTDPERMVTPERADSFTVRWDEVKGEFVDAPRQAVAKADALVGELLDELGMLFSQQRRSIEQDFDRDEVSTEELRMALRRYRSFFDRLLSV